jgi:hypothetical protein
MAPIPLQRRRGLRTIGYGHLVKKRPCDGTAPESFRAGLTEPEGAKLLVSDMANARSTVSAAVTMKLAEGQYAALCDFVFNVGSTNFRNSTLLSLLNAGQHDAVLVLPAESRLDCAHLSLSSITRSTRAMIDNGGPLRRHLSDNRVDCDVSNSLFSWP